MSPQLMNQELMSQQECPTVLDEQWHSRLEYFKDMASEELVQWLESVQVAEGEGNAFSDQLKRVWSCSEFVASACSEQPDMFRQLVESGDLVRSYNSEDMVQGLSQRLNDAESEEDLFRGLRQFRYREMVRIVWRDFAREASLEETTADMTRLAEACLQSALDFLYPIACEAWGTPLNANGDPQQMVVLGMGKMGAWELNVSSDIDLIFAYPESGETHGGRRSFSNQEFFVRLGQKLIKALDVRNADGFVFRVDMRLRPYGQSGALILNFDAMEEYYQTQGREWERYAMIKARVVAGDREAGEQLMAMLRPFTYRKYIDFSAIDSLRDMKALINREVQRKGISADVKRGAGGIREVEFVAQAFQIIRGGRDVRFQNPALKDILLLLAEEQLLPEEDVMALYQSYTFLRNVEHALQGWQDKQTQMLPDTELEQIRLAYLMGFDGWDSFLTCLDQHRALVRKIFEAVIADEQEQGQDSCDSDEFQQAKHIWQTEDDELISELSSLGYVDADQALASIKALQQSRSVVSMASDTRVRLDCLMPDVIAACSTLKNDAETLGRILQLIESIARRSAYLVLLKENPVALQSTIKLCAASPWIAEQLSLFPALLDELLDTRTLYDLPDRGSLEDELRQQLLRVPGDDLEAQMEVLRYFKCSHSLRIAACEVTEVLPLMKVSDYLTWLAEAILSHVLEIAWDQMTERHGRPGADDGVDPGFLIVGYGKLGGIELGHSSDLDMVFIHDANMNKSTDGERSVDNATFFMRLGQKIIHILTTQMVSGDLYEADMRLRPSGNSGMLVTSLTAFEKYQQEDAWTWEHQALVRARAVAGSRDLAKAFDEARHKVLCQSRDRQQLLADVVTMRDKMRAHLGTSVHGANVGRDKQQSVSADQEKDGFVQEEGIRFNLKQDAGGIVDIEFMVQFAVLARSHEFPDLTRWSDNVRILECLEEADVISATEVETLTRAYKKYRSVGHRLQLQNLPIEVNAAEFADEREQVAAIWDRLLGSDP